MANEPGSTGENFPHRFLKRIKERLSPRPAANNQQVPRNPLQAHGVHDADNLKRVRNELGQVVENHWPQRTVSLDQIHVRQEIPIGWKSIAEMGRAINRLKDEPLTTDDFSELRKPPEAVYAGVPMVASVIANKRNPAIPVHLPTEAEIKAMKPWLRDASWLIGKFSQNWKRAFDRVIERIGADTVINIGEKAYTVIQDMENINSPRQQFIADIAKLYAALAKPEFEESFTLFGGEERVQIPIEEKIENLLEVMRLVRDGYANLWINKTEYPLLARILTIIKFPPDSLDASTAGIAGAEMMRGIESFLKQQGVKNVRTAPRPKEFNLLSPDTWMRGLAEWFAPEKLARVQNHLPEILTHAKNALPENGPEFAQEVYTLAENVTILKQQGEDDKRIVESLFKK